MNRERYARHLMDVEGCDAAFSADHADELYDLAERDLMLDLAMDPDDHHYGPDLILRYLPALTEEHPSAHLLQLIDEKRRSIFSVRDAARQTLRHLEIIHADASPGMSERLIRELTEPDRLENEPLTALEFAKQFGKILKHYDVPQGERTVRRIWKTIAAYRALPPVLSFIAADSLPPYLDRGPVHDAASGETVHSDMVTPQRYLDPTDRGECGNAELLHEASLDTIRDEYGRLTLVESEDGTPVGSIKWDGYPSMVGLRTVIDSRGRHAVLPGAVYKLDESTERGVLHDQASGLRFARRRFAPIRLQPVRTMGGYWAGTQEYGDYRALIEGALTRPEFRKRG